MSLFWSLAAAGVGLKNGPMIGASAMSEVQLWVQTDGAAEVVIEYWNLDTPEHILRTEPIQTRRHYGFVAKPVADQVAAGQRYGYRVLINGNEVTPMYREGFRDGAIPLTFHTPRNWRFRASGHEVFDFTVGFGSCAYINEPEGGFDRMGGRPYGGEYQIFESIYEQSPDFFIWLGDNVYYREPDWTTRSGKIHRWTHDRSIPELRPMLATIPQYAIWDDHDYGPNDAGREYWHRELATEIFTLFWANPTVGFPGQGGISSYFAWGDVHFYLLDNRSFRSTPVMDPRPFGQTPQQLGKEQIDTLVELMIFNRWQSISSYPSTFHVVAVGSQILSPHSKDSLPSYPEEWQYLFDRLVQAEMHNVIFITGDVHFGEVSRKVYPGGGLTGVPGRYGNPGTDYVFWDITSSSLTAGSWPGAPAERNPYRFDIFPGETDRAGQRNFATLSFEGPLTERRAIIRFFDSDGNLLNQAPDAPAGTPTEQSVIHATHTNLNPRLFSQP